MTNTGDGFPVSPEVLYKALGNCSDWPAEKNEQLNVVTLDGHEIEFFLRGVQVFEADGHYPRTIFATVEDKTSEGPPVKFISTETSIFAAYLEGETQFKYDFPPKTWLKDGSPTRKSAESNSDSRAVVVDQPSRGEEDNKGRHIRGAARLLLAMLDRHPSAKPE